MLYLSGIPNTINKNLTITGDLTVSGNLNFGDSTTDILTVSGYMQGSVDGSTYLRVGNGTTSHALASTSDLFVTGNLEVDGASYFDGDVSVGSSFSITASNGNVSAGTYSSSSGLFTTSSGSATSVTLRGTETDSATAVGVILDNTNNLLNSTAKLVSIRNGGSEKVYITSGGSMVVVGNIQTSSSLISTYVRSASESLRIYGLSSDGAAAIGVRCGNYNTLSNDTAKIISFYNDAFVSEKSFIDAKGVYTQSLATTQTTDATVTTLNTLALDADKAYQIKARIVGKQIVDGSNIYTDGGLETWTSTTDLTNWTEEDVGGATGGTFEKEATTIHGGTYAGKFTNDASGNAKAIYQIQSGLTAGELYKTSFWAKGTAGGGSVRIVVFNNTPTTATQIWNFTTMSWDSYGGGPPGTGQYWDNNVTTTYQKFTSSPFTVPTNGQLVIIYHFVGANVVGYLDDVSLYTADNYATYEITASALGTTGNALLTGVTTVHSKETMSGLDATFGTSGSNIIAKVTGIAGMTFNWKGYLTYINY